MPLFIGQVYGETVVVSVGHHGGDSYSWICSEDSRIFQCDKPHRYPTRVPVPLALVERYVETAALNHLRLHTATPFN